MKLRHKETGEEFHAQHEKQWDDGSFQIPVWDRHGEYRLFKREVLEPVPVQEEWETVNGNQSYISYGVIHVIIRGKSVGYPHPDLRFAEIDGVTVLQRRKP
jgi:hypothetical protein